MQTGLGDTILTILLGMVFVTIIDTVGSITSRKYKFRYEYFIVFSLVAYTWVSYAVAQNNSNMAAFSAVLLVGSYDAIVGWEIAWKLKANYTQPKELLDKATPLVRLLSMAVFSLLCGAIGVGLAGV